MSDKIFERSLTRLTVLVLLWITLGIVFQVIGWVWAVLIGLLVGIVSGGLLPRFWGKSYMERE